MRMLYGSVLTAVFVLSPVVKANTLKGKNLQYFNQLKSLAPTTSVQAPADDIDTSLKNIIAKSEGKRSPAQAGNLNENMMTPEFKAIRDRFLYKVKTSDELDQLLAELDEKYDSLPNDAKIFAAQVIPVRPLRGIVYRLRNVFEKRSRAAHSAVLSVALNTATNFRIYLPQDSMKVVEEYFMSPFYENGKLVSSFNNEADIQGLLTGIFLSKIHQSNTRLGEVSLTQPVVWDQRLTYGPNTFQDGLNRFRLVGELEKSLIRSAMMGTVSSLYVLRSYDINESIDLAKDLGKLYGIDGFLSVVDGVSAEKVTSVLRKRPNIGQLLPDGAENMRNALNCSAWSMIFAKVAWDASSKERKDEELYAVDSGYWRVNRNDIEKNLDILYRVVRSDKSEKIRSSVTGDIIEIRYSDFFLNPPTDLKTFLPLKNGFNSQTNMTRMAVMDAKTQKKASITYRNYLKGSPEQWDVQFYQKYFPNVKSNDDVFKTVRVLSHAGGSWLNLVNN